MILKTVFITIIVPSAVLGTHYILLQYSLPHGPLINDCFQYIGVWTIIHLQLICQHGEVFSASYVLSFLLFVSTFIVIIGILFKAR